MSDWDYESEDKILHSQDEEECIWLLQNSNGGAEFIKEMLEAIYEKFGHYPPMEKQE